MARVILVHQGQLIVLPQGETLVGRGLVCRIRFNDPAVSRRHLRIYVAGAQAAVANLSDSNGTLFNGARLTEPRQLHHGDQLQVGYRRMSIEVRDEPTGGPGPTGNRADLAEEVGPVVIGSPSESEPGGSVLIDEARLAEESTRPGEEGWRKRRPRPTDPGPFAVHDCPRCRARVAFDENTCAQCGYAWPPGHPSSVTQPIEFETIVTRKEPRFAVAVPVIYSSGTLTIDAIVRDISRGGMFIATELLDPVGTPCELTALPDGHPVLHFSGVVAHVADSADPNRPAGIGIQFVGGSPEALSWLERMLARYTEAVVD